MWSTTTPSNSRRSQQLRKSTHSFWRVNISQSETALCGAMLAQSGTDAMVPLVPWPVPGHQRWDARQSPLGALQHAKKTQERNMRIIYWTSSAHWILHAKLEIVCCILRSVSLVAHENLWFRCNLHSHLALRLKGVSTRSKWRQRSICTADRRTSTIRRQVKKNVSRT